jgi:hypothetical protein
LQNLRLGIENDCNRRFGKMRKHLKCGETDVVLEIKSRNGNLSENNKQLIGKIF